MQFTQFHAQDATSNGVSRSLSSGTSAEQNRTEQLWEWVTSMKTKKRHTCGDKVLIEEKNGIQMKDKWYGEYTSGDSSENSEFIWQSGKK